MRHLLLCAALLAGCDSAADTPTQKTPAAQKKADAKPAKKKAVKKTANKSSSSSAQLPGYAGIYAKNPKLAPTRVAIWTLKQLRIKRNEVYARYGRAFKSADLQAHFGKQSWYTVRDGYSDALLTDNDRANVALIKSFEGEPPERDGQVGGLMFMSDTELVISDASSLYGHDGEERYYVARGSKYVITWSGSPKFDLRHAAVSDPELWTWTGGNWKRTPIQLPNG